MNWKEEKEGIFLVNVLGIIYDPKTKQILIGKRVNDKYISQLSWVFPGGKAGYEQDLETYVVTKAREKAGVKVDAKNVIFAKTYPEKREFLSIYYYCEYIDGEPSPNEGLLELKWVKPSEVVNYFTTSLHPKLLEYLKTLD